MKVLTTLTVSGGLNMASNAKDTFTIGTPLENNDGNVDELYVYANADFKNNVILGSSSVDRVVFNALVSSDIVPAESSSYSLGSSNKPFKEIFVGSGSISIASPIEGVAATTISNNSGNLNISAGGVNLVGTGSFIGSGFGLYNILGKHINNAYNFLTASGQTASVGATVVYLDNGNNASYGLPDVTNHDGMIMFMKNIKNTQATIQPYDAQKINGVAGSHTIAGNSYEAFHAVSGSSGWSWYTLFSAIAMFISTADLWWWYI
jgi:hypothetical protein